MTNEQREAIEICKEKIIESFYDFPNPTSIELKDTDVEAIEIVLSLIKEQQEEIEKKDKIIDFYKKGLEREAESNRENVMEIIKKDKQIDLMAKFIDVELSSLRLGTILNRDVKPLESYKEEIKQYFERKVEEC